MLRQALLTALSALVVIWAVISSAAPAAATTEYEYATGEDVVIDSGMAPNRRLSLASHGAGPSGNDKFHVYLMAEPAHRRIAALDYINSHDILDSGPTAFYASWAPDSRHAAVAFRTDRHVMVTLLYRIEHGRAVEIGGSSLFKDVTNREVHSQNDDERVSVTRLSWLSPRRFVLSEYRYFIASSSNLLRSLGRFGALDEKNADDKRLFVKFSAEAECVAGTGIASSISSRAISTTEDGIRNSLQN